MTDEVYDEINRIAHEAQRIVSNLASLPENCRDIHALVTARQAARSLVWWLEAAVRDADDCQVIGVNLGAEAQRQ